MNIFENFEKLNKTINNIEKLIKTNDAVKEILKNSLITNYHIRNDETLEKLFNFNNIINWSMYLPKAPFEDYVKMTDALITLKKHSHLFSNHLKFASFLNHITTNIDSRFIEAIDKVVPKENENDLEQSNEIMQEEVQVIIKRPVFFNLALKINIVLNTTEGEVQEGKLDEQEEDAWKKILKPILTALGQLFLAWALSDTPLHDTNIYKSIENIIEYIDSIQIEDGDILELPQEKEQLNNETKQMKL
mgnify:CR=1 FL=1